LPVASPAVITGDGEEDPLLAGVQCVLVLPVLVVA
jgi:hypothetical protein